MWLRGRDIRLTAPGPAEFNPRDFYRQDQIIQQPLHHLIAPTQVIKQASTYNYTMSVQLPPATHRKRALPQGELEAASTLKLGADQHTHTLSLSEARLVIHKVLENKRRGGNKYEEPE